MPKRSCYDCLNLRNGERVFYYFPDYGADDLKPECVAIPGRANLITFPFTETDCDQFEEAVDAEA